MSEGEKVDWDTFIQKFKTGKCRVEGDKLVCEGLLDNDKPVICEVTQKEGKPEISCRYDVSSPV
jgi:hypothetical protein